MVRRPTFEELTETLWSHWTNPTVKINHSPVDEDDAREHKSYLERLLDEASDSREEYEVITDEILEKYSDCIDVPEDECDQFHEALSKILENYAYMFAIAEHALHYMFYGHGHGHLTKHVGDDRRTLFWRQNQQLLWNFQHEKNAMEHTVHAALRGHTIFGDNGHTIFGDNFKGLTNLSAEDRRLKGVTNLKEALVKQKAETHRASTEALSLKKALEIEKAESTLASAEILSLKEALEKQKAETAQASAEALGFRKALEIIGSAQASAEILGLKEALEKQKAETAQASAEALGFRKALEIIGSAQASAEILGLKEALEKQKAESALASQESADVYSAQLMKLRWSNTTLQSDNAHLTTRVEQLASFQEEAMQAKAEK